MLRSLAAGNNSLLFHRSLSSSRSSAQRWLSAIPTSSEVIVRQSSGNVGRVVPVAARCPWRVGAIATTVTHARSRSSPSGLRVLSSATDKENTSNSKSSSDKAKGNDGSSANDAENDSKEIALTPGETVVAVSRLSMWAGILAFASVCAYYIGKELFPSKMSPNRVFDRSFNVVRSDPEVQRRYGDALKAYGRDHGGHREGRRNFIEHTEYTSPDDGSKRTRVRYNIEGRFGYAFVFAEVSANLPDGEFVYILVQDKSNGRTQTIVDNRAAMTAARLAGDNKEASSAMSQLLKGSGNDK